MYRIYIIGFFLLLQTVLSAKEKKPLIVRLQEKKVAKHIHAFTAHDSLIETAEASIYVHYSNDGHKPFLLLLHGMGVDGQTNWYKQIKSLSKHYNLIIPDLIYFGKSKAKKEDFSVEFQARQMHELLLILGIKEDVNVMGFSYGGLTAAVYNELYPTKKGKLILMDAPVKFYSTQLANDLAKLAGVDSMKNIIIPQNLKEFSALEKAVLSRKIPIFKKQKLKIIQYYFIPSLSIRLNQLNYLQQEEKRYQNYTYNLEKTSTLLIWGAKDGVVPLSVGEELHRSFPTTTQLVVYKKAKHDVHFRYARKLNKKVLGFLKN